MMKPLTLSEIETTIGDYLTELGFSAKKHYLVDKSFDIDLLATRGGLTVILEIVERDRLSFDSIAKLETIGVYLKQKMKVISLRKILATTSVEIPKDIVSFAVENSIILLKITPRVEDVQNALNKLDFLKPFSRTEIDVLKIVEQEMKKIGERECLIVLNNIKEWYLEGGSNLVSKRIRKKIDKLSLGE